MFEAPEDITKWADLWACKSELKRGKLARTSLKVGQSAAKYPKQPKTTRDAVTESSF